MINQYQYNQQNQYGQTQMNPNQYGQPPMNQNQYGQTQMNPNQYGQPKMNQNQYGQQGQLPLMNQPLSGSQIIYQQ